MLRAVGQAFTRAVDFFIEANVDHALQKRKLNSIPKGYREFRKEFYHAANGDILKGVHEQFGFNKWVSVAELMHLTHVAAGGGVFATPHDKKQHLQSFTKALKRAIHTDPSIARKGSRLLSEQARRKIPDYERVDSLDGFYVRAVDIWDAILEADLPDGGQHHRAGSFHAPESANEEVPRAIFVDGQEHKEWLNYKHPMIYALARASDCTRTAQNLAPYNPQEDGFIKDQTNNPYMP